MSEIYQNVTIQDCEEMLAYKNKRVVLNDGKVVCFEEE